MFVQNNERRQGMIFELLLLLFREVKCTNKIVICSYTLKMCTEGKGKKKRNTPIYFTKNYRTEMKLEPIIIDYCLLQFDALKFFLGIRLHGGGVYT